MVILKEALTRKKVLLEKARSKFEGNLDEEENCLYEITVKCLEKDIRDTIEVYCSIFSYFS